MLQDLDAGLSMPEWGPCGTQHACVPRQVWPAMASSITEWQLALVWPAACRKALSSHMTVPWGLRAWVFAQPYSLDMPTWPPPDMKQASKCSQVRLAVGSCTPPPACADQTGCKACMCSLCIEAPSMFSAKPLCALPPLLTRAWLQPDSGGNAPSSLSQKPAGPVF